MEIETLKVPNTIYCQSYSSILMHSHDDFIMGIPHKFTIYHEKEPNDGVIMDSLGWVYFKTGDYQKAITYLEKASELNPSNAIITDHLGDAYWLGGRKNEAIFQWKQALTQKEENDELNRKRVKNKIENGLRKKDAYSLKDEKIKETLEKINEITQ